MKGFIIYEDYRGKKVVEAIKLGVVNYTCKSEDSDWVSELSGIRKESTQTTCNKDDTYDFEVGALIALMKMCGRDKVTKACDELYKDDKYKNALQEMTENNEKLIEENNYLKYIKSCNESIIKSLENTRDLLINKNKELIEENKKLKLDCEKLQHGYNDMIFCGGRQNGKQYTALVNMFKKLDQKKVDAAYKEAYNTTLPVWQKEVLNQMYGVYKESKEKPELPRTLDINGTTYLKSFQIIKHNDQLDSLVEESRAFTRKCDDEWLNKPLTKREEMWGNILGKNLPIEIKVTKQDITSFLRELQDKIPEVRWNGSDCPPTENTIADWFNHDYIYFALFRNNNKLKLCYDDKSHSWINKPVIIYLPPMRWDLFKKGRKIVRITPENLDDFMTKCSNNLGCIIKPTYKYDTHVFIMISDYHYDNKPTLHIMSPEDLVRNQYENQKKYSDKKIVDWEEVR